MSTTTTKRLLLAMLATSVALASPLEAQVETEAPPLVPGVKPVTAERVTIHGPALRGNLEGNALDRDTLVFLPPSSHTSKVADRFQNHVMRFFSRNLCFDGPCR
jgi:hypothetical protein